MDELVNTVNLLQDVFSASECFGIDLPQIVVVGTQSSGKSSVLEHLVGKTFLPRGTGVVTRCPLVLQLLPGQGEVAKDHEYAIFHHDKSKVFTDYQLIKREIEMQTNRLAGLNKGICKTPITLKIFSASFLNLTLVDLPGITKVPVGDQPHDIENQTRSLILQYITKPNCLILAVVPANADMATSESLKIAREVDPEGARTLAVITKLDLMDKGTDAMEMLTGKVIPVKLGIVGVVNRSQKNIQDDKSIEQTLKDEAEFFQTNYRSIADHQGCLFLAKKVQTLLVSHIRCCMPKLRERVNQKLAKKKTELQQIGDSNLDNPSVLLALITKFSNSFASSINGHSSNVETSELQGGARIKWVFQESLPNALINIDPLAGLTETDIVTAMENASGISNALFMSSTVFELLVKRQIERLRNPCLKCVDLIYEELSRIIESCIDDSNLELQTFPKLQREMEDILSDFLQGQLPITRGSVDNFIDIQLAYINTAHPDLRPTYAQSVNPNMMSGDRYDSGEGLLVARGMSSTMVRFRDDPSRSSQGQLLQYQPSTPAVRVQRRRDYNLIQELIQNYFSIVRKTVEDTVPKIIMHSLVNFAVENLQLVLVRRLYTNDAEDILQESQDIVDMRRELKRQLGQLEQASAIINTFSASGVVTRKN